MDNIKKLTSDVSDIRNAIISLNEREELEFYRYFIVREGLEFECALEFHKFKERAKKGRRTYLEDYKEKFPKSTDYDDDGIPRTVCRSNLYGKCECEGKDCIDCWNEIMEESI